MAAGPPTGPPPVKSPQLSLQSLRLDDPVPLTGPQSPSGHIQFLVKLLLSQAQAGSVIGKGGDSILAIQSSTGCKLRVAGPTDCYPGVSERVAALTGSVLPLTNALMHIIQRLSGEQGSPRHADADASLVLLKILIPETAGGLLIGKGGSTIAEIRSTSGADVRVSTKMQLVLPFSERIVSVSGTAEQVSAAVTSVMSVLSTDLLKFRYTSGDTISYASVVGGSPTAAGPPAGWASPAYPYGAGSGSSYSPSTSSRGSPRTPSYFPFPPPSPTSTASAAPPPPPPPSSDPSGGAPVDVEGSVEGWATDGSMAPSRTPQSSTGSVDPTAASSWTYPPHAAYPGYSGYGYPPATYTDYAAWQQYTAAMAQASYVTCKICADVCVCTSEEMSLPEVQIGAVFGKGGAGLKWLQSSTGTRVVVSSRRAVSPDTPFRTLTIVGPPANIAEAKRIMLERASASVHHPPHRHSHLRDGTSPKDPQPPPHSGSE